MRLLEDRLKPYVRSRVTPGETNPASGLKEEGATQRARVHLDIQVDSRPTPTDDYGRPAVTGPYTAFTYDGHRLQRGDLITGTPYGSLEVISLYRWDDVDPIHYEVALRVT